MSMKNRIAAVACGLALAGTVAMPVAALAAQDESGNVTDQNTGTTEVTVKSYTKDDGSGDVDQLNFSVPTVIPFAVQSGGQLVTATADNLKIQNLSVFPIHVANMKVAHYGNWNVVDDVDTATDTTNNIQFKLNGAAAREAGVGVAWGMSYHGNTDKDSVTLKMTDGKVSNVTEDIKDAKQVATITWTLASGNVQ